MKTHEIEARDRAANDSGSTRENRLEYTVEVANGEYNCDLAIEATEDGILVDCSHVIPWKWILSSLKVLRKDGLDLEDS